MENLYELMLLNRPELNEKDEKKIFTRLDEIISGKGKVIKSVNLGKKQLAYRIKKQSEGIYWVLNLNLTSSEVPAFSQKISMEENVLRFLILKKDEKIEEPKKEIKKVTEEKKKIKKVRSK